MVNIVVVLLPLNEVTMNVLSRGRIIDQTTRQEHSWYSSS